MNTPPEEFVRPTKAERDAPENKIWQAKYTVKSTARPAAPKVLYAVPTFGWGEETKQNGKTRTREGHGLRVYLDRPWHTSGFGEMLAVVLARTDQKQAIADSMLPLVSQCGADPIHEEPDPADNVFLQLKDFEAPVLPVSNLTLAEQPGTPVDAAAFAVQFDADRELWYADLMCVPKFDYFPFVALALARYQPNSETGAELSNVVKLDPVQIVPNRVATVSSTLNNSSGGGTAQNATVSVSVTGKMWKANDSNGLPANVFQAIVERLDPNLGADFGWQPIQTVKLDKFSVAGRLTAWLGDLKLKDATGKLRVRVAEYELYNGAGAVPDAKTVMTLQDVLGESPGARLVYTDVFPLN